MEKGVENDASIQTTMARKHDQVVNTVADMGVDQDASIQTVTK